MLDKRPAGQPLQDRAQPFGVPVRRNTRQRQVIRDVFAAARRPLGVREAAAFAKERLASLGIATVYRTIRDLLDERWLVPLALGGQTRFERSGIDHHHHFHCSACDQVFDIEGCAGNVEGLAPKGFVAHAHEITVSGLCDACGKRTRKGRKR
jgi:Fur family transcriptional regulator, ferric uptake regulator